MSMDTKRSGGSGSSPRIRARRAQWRVTALALAVCILVMANAVVFDFQMDLTPEGRFSLSNTTEALLETIDEPLEIRFYVSERLRELSDEPERMERLLRRYDDLGGAAVSVEVIDATGEAAERARAAGLRSEQIPDGNDEALNAQSVFSGVTVQYLDRERAVPFVFGHAQIEYQVSNAIWDVLRDDPPRIAVILGSEGERFEVDYDQLQSELADRFELRVIDEEERIPHNTDVVMLLGSRNLSTDHASRISRFLESGGAVFLAVDGLRLDLSTLDAQPVGDPAAGMTNGLLAPLGVQIQPVALLDGRNNSLQAVAGGASERGYPPWVATDHRNADPEHPVTRYTSGVDFFWPSPLRLEATERGVSEPLIVSSPEGWLLDEPLNLQPDNRAALTRTRDQTLGSYALAAWSENAPVDGARAIVVGDSDFASNLVFYTESLHNFMFVERSLLWLLGEDRVAQLHTRAGTPAPLDRIEAEFARVFTARIVSVLNTVAVPLLVLIAGWLRLRNRRRRDEQEGM